MGHCPGVEYATANSNMVLFKQILQFTSQRTVKNLIFVADFRAHRSTILQSNNMPVTGINSYFVFKYQLTAEMCFVVVYHNKQKHTRVVQFTIGRFDVVFFCYN